MARQKSDFWTRARNAQARLAEQFLVHPDVTLIDIGYVDEEDKSSEKIAIRIHVRERWFQTKPEDRVVFPKEEDRIPVVVMAGEYQAGK